MQPVIQLFCALAAVGLGALAPTTNISGTASAQEYPQRPVTLIIPVAAGTGADVIARVLAERLSERWGQQVVIINRPGAAGAIAAQAAASAAPDGYTLYMAVSSAFIVIPETKVKWPVDLATDFVPIGWISDQPMIIAVAPSLGVTTLSEFIDLAKRKPDDILFGAARLSVPHLTGALLNDRAGIKMRYIPTVGAAKVMQDIMNGNLNVVTDSVPGIRGAIQNGTVKALAFTGESRLANYPDLPLASETLPNFHVRGWFVLMAPAKNSGGDRQAGEGRSPGDAGAARVARALRADGNISAPDVVGGGSPVVDRGGKEPLASHRASDRSGLIMDHPIVIIGGGISGLALALSLHEAGIRCRIFEAAPAFRRLGVGINMQPYGVCELAGLGLLPALRAHSVEPCEMNYYNRFGQLVFSEPRGRSAGYGWPQLSLHRGDLHDVLVAEVTKRLGPDALTLDHQCTGVEQDEAGVTVYFADFEGARADFAAWARGDRV